MTGPAPLLRTRGLVKRYPEVTAVDGLDGEVPRGRVGLVGANGAGKTTLFRMMLGMSHPTEGSLEVCGVDVAADPIAARSRRSGERRVGQECVSTFRYRVSPWP